MKVIHGIGFTPEEIEGYRQQVFMNLWEAMRLLLEGMEELEMRLADPENRVRLLERTSSRSACTDGMGCARRISVSLKRFRCLSMDKRFPPNTNFQCKVYGKIKTCEVLSTGPTKSSCQIVSHSSFLESKYQLK